MSVSVSIEHVVKNFGDFKALKDVSIAIKPGELFFLLGPSGCGKTTLLRCIAGFHTPDSGRVMIGERDVTTLPPYKRDTGMMFQSYALWPHMTLAENVAFGLEMRKVPKAELQKRVMEALELVHLGDRAKARPNQLSGGQQQRVALARALVIRPQCLLLDEPLSNLDAKLRLEMRMEIRRICKQAGLTAIYVTHDQKEALSIADRLAVMQSGEIQQVGSPAEVYRRPVSRFVAGFIGEGNFIEGNVTASDGDRLSVETPYGIFTVGGVLPIGQKVTLCLRPEAIRFDEPPADAPNQMHGAVHGHVYLGEIAQRTILLPGPQQPFELKAFEINPQTDTLPEGAPVSCWIHPEQIIVTAE